MEKRKKGKNDWIGWVKVLLFAFGLAFIVRMFFFAPIVVDGPSMLPTLHDGDQMIVNKISYRIHEPERFDIIVFHASAQKDFIKRVIGLPGEHVEVVDNELFIDGEKVQQPFLKEKTDLYQTAMNDFTLETIPGGYEISPEGKVLVLGDNRSNSTDSRMLGLISMDQIVGKTNLIFRPFNRMQILGE